jgi:hypothetical protein
MKVYYEEKGSNYKWQVENQYVSSSLDKCQG